MQLLAKNRRNHQGKHECVNSNQKITFVWNEHEPRSTIAIFPEIAAGFVRVEHACPGDASSICPVNCMLYFNKEFHYSFQTFFIFIDRVA